MGGYESSCHINRHGIRLDIIAVTQHDVQVRQDYEALRKFGITSARDGLRWHLIDSGGRYNFSSFLPMLTASSRTGVQIIWDLCHYGWPDDLDVFSAAFVDRFARFSKAVAQLIADSGDQVPFYTPINELSFLPWGIGRGVIYPFVPGRDGELKRQFVRASIAAVDAILAVDPRARFVYPDPVINVVPPRNHPEMAEDAASYRQAQFEAWDMICGRSDKDLGGRPGYLDIIGVNYYCSSQWEHSGERLRWEDTPPDPRMLPFRVLLAEVFNRYRRPLFISETGHYGAGRARWIREIAGEVHGARAAGVPVEGICLYPILDRPDWEDLGHWHQCGLWDIHTASDGRLTRVLDADFAAEFLSLQSSTLQHLALYR